LCFDMRWIGCFPLECPSSHASAANLITASGKSSHGHLCRENNIFRGFHNRIAGRRAIGVGKCAV
jgi:hypothetical protein